MGEPDYFKDIDFGKAWDEEDWEKFFRAQERLARAKRVSAAEPARASKGLLPFRSVLRQFGMDPEQPHAAPAEFEAVDPRGASRLAGEFWKEGADVEALPIYLRSQAYAAFVAGLCERRLAAFLSRLYKSKSHRVSQEILKDLRDQSGRIAENLAAGHHLGYGREAGKGNIARCKRALAHADACVGLVSRLAPKRLPAADYRRLFRDSLRLRNELMDWIAFLRLHFC